MLERINSNLNPEQFGGKSPVQSPKFGSFSDLLTNNLHQVDQLQKRSDQITQDFVLGKTDNIHRVTLASEKAQIALSLTIAIQNKVIEAYEEIMRLQV